VRSPSPLHTTFGSAPIASVAGSGGMSKKAKTGPVPVSLEPERTSRPVGSPTRQGVVDGVARPERTCLHLLRQALVVLRGVRMTYAPGSDGWHALLASERLLMIQVRDQHGEDACTAASEDPYLDHRPA
jgi:hypothetical protein